METCRQHLCQTVTSVHLQQRPRHLHIQDRLNVELNTSLSGMNFFPSSSGDHGVLIGSVNCCHYFNFKLLSTSTPFHEENIAFIFVLHMHATDEGVVQCYLSLSSNSKVADVQGMLVPYSSRMIDRTALSPSLPNGNSHFQTAHRKCSHHEGYHPKVKRCPLWPFTWNLGPL